MPRQRKSRGRDLKHTETQAALEVSRRVTNERGRTDGLEKVGAVSAVSPNLRRKPPRTFRNPSLTRSDLANLPPDAKVQVNGAGLAKLAVYFRK